MGPFADSRRVAIAPKPISFAARGRLIGQGNTLRACALTHGLMVFKPDAIPLFGGLGGTHTFTVEITLFGGHQSAAENGWVDGLRLCANP
jgi:hypothetical protein